METVTRSGDPPGAAPLTGTMISASFSRSRSAIPLTSSALVCGSKMTNSSPPNRPAMSDSRTCWRSSPASARSMSSPMRCPCVSLISLKWSTSASSSATQSLRRSALVISASASRCHAAAFSSPVFASVRAAAVSWACMRLRCSSSAGGSATSSSSGLSPQAIVTRIPTQISVRSSTVRSRSQSWSASLPSGSASWAATATRNVFSTANTSAQPMAAATSCGRRYPERPGVIKWNSAEAAAPARPRAAELNTLRYSAVRRIRTARNRPRIAGAIIA